MNYWLVVLFFSLQLNINFFLLPIFELIFFLFQKIILSICWINIAFHPPEKDYALNQYWVPTIAYPLILFCELSMYQKLEARRSEVW